MPLLPLLVPAMVQVMTKPWVYIGIIGLFAVSKFDLSKSIDQAGKTLLSLWPYAILWLVFLLALEVIRIKLRRPNRK